MNIKRAMLLSLLALSAVAAAASGEYCDGYKEGYRDGYAQVTGAPPTPMSPLCPMKPPRRDGEKRSDHDLGYDRGLKDGIRDGSR